MSFTFLLDSKENATETLQYLIFKADAIIMQTRWTINIKEKVEYHWRFLKEKIAVSDVLWFLPTSERYQQQLMQLIDSIPYRETRLGNVININKEFVTFHTGISRRYSLWHNTS